jgi:hypothetical protein
MDLFFEPNKDHLHQEIVYLLFEGELVCDPAAARRAPLSGICVMGVLSAC